MPDESGLSGTFEYLDDITESDIAFKARGAGLGEVFAAAWEAVLTVQVENPAELRDEVRKSIELTADNPELLLHDFLEEQLYLRDTTGALLRTEHVDVRTGAGRCTCSAGLAGERPDGSRHVLGVDVKAVTMYRFSLCRTDEGWEAVAVLDV